MSGPSPPPPPSPTLQEQSSLLGSDMFQQQEQRRHQLYSYQQYDSLCYSSTDSDTASKCSSHPSLATMPLGVDRHVLHIDGGEIAANNSTATPTSRRRGRTAKRVIAIFCVSLLMGLLMWFGIYAYEWTEDADEVVNDGTSSLRFFSRGLWGKDDTGDDNDDDGSIYYKSSTSIADLLPVPLLGRSKAFRAQETANHARDYLYVDPKEVPDIKPPQKKHKLIQEEILGSNGYSLKKAIQAKEGCEGTIMIMRHCEKGTIREHCNYLGYERSVYLASLFGNEPGHRWPEPSFLVAESPGMRRNPGKKNYRELETILPLADKFNLPVDSSFSSLETTKLAHKIQGMLRSGEMCGKLMLISWKHSKIPQLAHAMACGPDDGCPWHYHGNRFDELWQIKFVYRTPLHSVHKDLRPPKHHEWMVFGSVQLEGFDPLAFSKQVGDYPGSQGSKTGGRWLDFDHEIEERQVDPTELKKKKKKKFKFP